MHMKVGHTSILPSNFPLPDKPIIKRKDAPTPTKHSTRSKSSCTVSILHKSIEGKIYMSPIEAVTFFTSQNTKHKIPMSTSIQLLIEESIIPVNKSILFRYIKMFKDNDILKIPV